MSINIWTLLSIVVVTLGGVLLGRALNNWAQHKISRVQLLAGLLSGCAAAGIGMAIYLQRSGDPAGAWLQILCVVVLAGAILVETRERLRTTR